MKRQPYSSVELDKTIQAMWAAEVDCIRYGGEDDRIIRRLFEASLSRRVDHPAQVSAQEIVRDHVTFKMPAPQDNPKVLADMFRQEQKRRGRKVLPKILGRNTIWLSWFGWHFHGVHFQKSSREDRLVLTLRSYALPDLAFAVNDWLVSKGATSIMWHSRTERNGGSSSRTTPA
jgi:hypothetical protein